jgi:photosystem II stability/assembly factor-like uncharacterized protein
MNLTGTGARRTWRTVAAACALAGLLAAAVLALASQPASGSPARDAAAAARFGPTSVTFASPEHAWALGTAPCRSAGACLQLRESTDAGRSWSRQALPAALLAAADARVGGTPADLYEGAGAALNVRFADARDGWIYGGLAVAAKPGGPVTGIRATLWSTHNGGVSWKQQALHGLGEEDAIYDLEAARGSAHLMESNPANDVSVESSPVSEDRWQPSSFVTLGSPAGGGEQAGSFVLAGASGWLVEGNDRGTTGSAQLAGGRWVAWTPPCASVGHSFAVPAASSPRDLVAVCVMGGFAYGLSRSAPPGASLGSRWLYFSSDGGESFTAGRQLPASVGSGVLASPAPGVILAGGNALSASFDAGLHWSVVYRGEVSYLGFTTRSQGVGIVGSGSGAASTMIMTFNGGRSWAPVSF